MKRLLGASLADLEAAYATPSPWVRANFVTSLDGAIELDGVSGGLGGPVDQEVFESIYTPGKKLLLASWQDAAAADRWTSASSAGAGLRHRQVRVIRDYGMFDRREAPQYYPPVRPAG